MRVVSIAWCLLITSALVVWGSRHPSSSFAGEGAGLVHGEGRWRVTESVVTAHNGDGGRGLNGSFSSGAGAAFRRKRPLQLLTTRFVIPKEPLKIRRLEGQEAGALQLEQTTPWRFSRNGMVRIPVEDGHEYYPGVGTQKEL